jgi:hypothetical protein
MNTSLINLTVGMGILRRNNSDTMAGCTATFERFLVE